MGKSRRNPRPSPYDTLNNPSFFTLIFLLSSVGGFRETWQRTFCFNHEREGRWRDPRPSLTWGHRCIAGTTSPGGPPEDADWPPLLPSLSPPPRLYPRHWDQHLRTVFVSGRNQERVFIFLSWLRMWKHGTRPWVLAR